MDAISQLLTNIASQGPWAALCVILIIAIYKLFGRYEDARKDQIADAKAWQEDSRKVQTLVGELRPLIQDLTTELNRRRRTG